MQRLRNIDPITKTVPGHGQAEPGRELPGPVPDQVARHLRKSGGWEPVPPPQLIIPASALDDEEE